MAREEVYWIQQLFEPLMMIRARRRRRRRYSVKARGATDQVRFDTGSVVLHREKAQSMG